MMFRIAVISLTCLFALSVSSTGQGNTAGASKNLEKMFLRLSGNLPADEKLKTNDSVQAFIDSFAASDTAFNYRFRSLRYLGQIMSPDSLVKIITWNLILDDGTNQYFCYLIRREKKRGGGTVIKLKAAYNENAERVDTAYSVRNWYGALYYDLRPFDLNGSTKYIVLGIDYGNSFVTRKLIDVLSFGTGGDVTFGLNCFSDGQGLNNQRILFEYSSKAVMSLRFEADNTIVFDHLSPFSPQYKGDHQFYGPDFSFDSYKLDNGLWRYKGDIDIRNK
ncbi:MAG: hypothetical protein ABR974_03560 [Bacteroidales bacterium]|jgi:hypothetical protein